MHKTRCAWVGSEPIYQLYHDTEWGRPEYDDERLFEKFVLDSFQAGLSWITVLKKRDNFRTAFDGFDAVKIAGYSESKIAELLNDPGIIRNKLKIHATIGNAKAYLRLMDEEGFSNYLWQFVNHSPIVNKWENMKKVPATSMESDAMSKDMKKRGFKFCGSTICYAFMQAVGMVNDHTLDCFCRKEILEAYE